METNKEYNQTIKNKIDRNAKLMEEKLLKINNLEYEISLIKDNQVSTLTSFTSPIHFIDLLQIWGDFDQENHKFKKDRKKSKDWMSFLENNYFFKKDYGAKLQEIIQSCDADYRPEGYDFIYKIDKDFGFTIHVPMFQNTTVNNYINMNFRIYEHVTDSYLKCVYSTLFVEDLMEQVDLFITERRHG